MAAITERARGLRFPEGPIAMLDGSIVLVEIERQTLSRVHPDGAVSVVAAAPWRSEWRGDGAGRTVLCVQ